MIESKKISYSILGVGVAVMLVIIWVIGFALWNQSQEQSQACITSLSGVDAKELTGLWKADYDLTMSFPGNRSFDQDALKEVCRLYITNLKVQREFYTDGQHFMSYYWIPAEFTYRIVNRDGDIIIIESQIVVAPRLKAYIPKDSFQSIREQWKILAGHRVARRMTWEQGIWWLVYQGQ